MGSCWLLLSSGHDGAVLEEGCGGGEGDSAHHSNHTPHTQLGGDNEQRQSCLGSRSARGTVVAFCTTTITTITNTALTHVSVSQLELLSKVWVGSSRHCACGQDSGG